LKTWKVLTYNHEGVMKNEHTFTSQTFRVSPNFKSSTLNFSHFSPLYEL